MTAKASGQFLSHQEDEMLDRIGSQLQRHFNEHTYEIIGAMVFLLAAILVAFIVGRAIRFVMSESFEIDKSISMLAVRLFRFVVVTLALVVVFGELGVDVTSVIAAFSVLGLALAFGLRSTMTNFFTGAMIGALKPYEVGDEIDAERVKGVVESTNLFCTDVITDDGTFVSVPNGPMWAKSIKNKSRIRPMRLTLDITVGRTTTFGEVHTIISDAFAADTSRYSAFAPRIKIEDVTEADMILQASAWYMPVAYWQAREAMPQVLTEMLEAAGIDNSRVVSRGLAKPKSPAKEPEAEPAGDDIL